MRKLISWVSALALASSVVTVPILANAEVTETLISNNFNGYENDVSYVNYANNIGDVLVYGNEASAEVTLTNLKLIVSSRKGADDTSYWKADESEGNGFLTTSVSRFSTAGRGSKLQFSEKYAPGEGENLVLSFKFKIKDPVTEGYAPAFKIGNTLVSRADFGVESDVWATAKLVINSEGSKLYNESNLVKESDDKELSEIDMSALSADGTQIPSKSEVQEGGYADYMTVSFDDMVLYKSSDPLTDPVPEAQDPEGSIAKPTETPEYDAPSLSNPADTTLSDSFTFENEDEASWTMIKDVPQTIEDIEGMSITLGSRENDSSTYAKVEKHANGKVLTLGGGRWSGAGRGPIVKIKKNLDITGSSSTTVMAFAAKLSDNNKGNAGKLYILNDDEKSSSTNLFIHEMAVLVADGTGSTITRGGNTQDVIGIDVTADDWHIVTVMISSDKYRVFVDGEQKIDSEYVSSGDSAVKATALPVLAVANARSDLGSGPYSLVSVDNIITYQGVLDKEASKLLPTEGEISETPTEPAETEKPGEEVQAVAKAATKVEGEELRISDGTKGAVFKFDLSGYKEITSANLIVKAAPRAYAADNKRWESTEISTYLVGSTWSGEGPTITEEEWDKLSKHDPINKQNTSHYSDGEGTAVAPWQTLEPIDVTSYVKDDSDGLVFFAFKTGSAREHAIDAVLEITAKEADKWTVYTATYKDGVLNTVTMEPVDDPTTVGDVNVSGTNNEDGTITKKLLWLGMTPYVAPAAE